MSPWSSSTRGDAAGASGAGAGAVVIVPTRREGSAPGCAGRAIENASAARGRERVFGIALRRFGGIDGVRSWVGVVVDRGSG